MFQLSKRLHTSSGDKSANSASSLANISHCQGTSHPDNNLLSRLLNARGRHTFSTQRSPNWSHFLSYHDLLTDNEDIDLTVNDNSNQPVIVEHLDLSAEKSLADHSDANTEKHKNESNIEEFVFDSTGARVTFRYRKTKKYSLFNPASLWGDV